MRKGYLLETIDANGERGALVKGTEVLVFYTEKSKNWYGGSFSLILDPESKLGATVSTDYIRMEPIQ